MKKTFCALIMIIFVLSAMPFSVLADDEFDVPVLEDVSFDHAVINGEFSSTQLEYELALDSSGESPTLNSYKVSEGAEIFFAPKNINGEKSIEIEVKKDNITTNYIFKYIDGPDTEVNNDNMLSELVCELGEVYPRINDKDTSYSLYIPSDMTEMRLSAVARDVNATCDVPSVIMLKTDQSLKFEVTVTASNGETRLYTFNVKRLDKDMQQVKQEMQREDFTSLVKGELFHQKPEFRIIVICCIAGVAVIIIAVILLKRYIIKTEDDDETEFFDYQSDDEENDVI